MSRTVADVCAHCGSEDVRPLHDRRSDCHEHDVDEPCTWQCCERAWKGSLDFTEEVCSAMLCNECHELTEDDD